METILEALERLKVEAEARRKHVDEILELVQVTLKSTQNTMQQAERSFHEMQISFIAMTELVAQLSKDRDELKAYVKKLKKSFWLRVLGA
jgi:acetolactate synthase small subunit